MELFTALLFNRHDVLCKRQFPCNTLEEAYVAFKEYCQVYSCRLLIVENAKNCTEIDGTYESYSFFTGEVTANS